MAHIRQGMEQQARAELLDARGVIDGGFKEGAMLKDGYWWDWFIARILLREADSLMGGKQPL
jgi:hypothetical protein